MDVRNCRMCGKLFNHVMGPAICPNCKEKMEEKFQTVKKYIQENHGADIMQVAEECEVDAAQIRQWIREERLQFADDSPIMIPCERCGAMIRSGKFCEKCKNEMANSLRSAITPAKEPAKPQQKPVRSDKDRMRFL